MLVSRILSLDYLWNEIRVKGGAYGAGFSQLDNGMSRFYSYRDPACDESLERYTKAGDWLSTLKLDDLDFEGYIISCIGSLDTPLPPQLSALKLDALRYQGKPYNYLKQLRDEVLATTKDDITQAAQELTDPKRKQSICVFGSKQSLKNSQAHLKLIELIAEDGDALCH